MIGLSLTRVEFPEIELKTRDAHKLRGYFGNVFRSHSPLLHNHYETGELRYRYPLVQYKVLKGIPTLVALGEGAELLADLFLKIRDIEIEGRMYPVTNKHIKSSQWEIGVTNDLRKYQFKTLWMALNQKNHKAYILGNANEKSQLLKRILIGNILSFFKNTGLQLGPDQRIMTALEVEERKTTFKDHSMLAFTGTFTANVDLPNLIGIGKSVSRGFGTIHRLE